MDTFGILFIVLVFLVIAIGAIRGKAAKPEHFVEEDYPAERTHRIAAVSMAPRN